MRTPEAPAVASSPSSRRIEEAALELFFRKGYAGSSIRELAVESDIATATLFHYFPSKLAILECILHRAIDDLARELDERLAQVTDPQTRLRIAITVLVVQHCEKQAASFVAQSELRSLSPDEAARIKAKRVRVQRIFDAAVQGGVKSGAFHCDHPLETSRAILNMGTQVAVWYQRDGRLTPQQLADIYCDLAQRMLGVHD
jgi:AcrR family transcriptional regulator